MKALLLIIIALALLSRAISAETIASATLRVTLVIPEKPIGIHTEPGQDTYSNRRRKAHEDNRSLIH